MLSTAMYGDDDPAAYGLSAETALARDLHLATTAADTAVRHNSLRPALGWAPHIIAALEAGALTLAVHDGVEAAKKEGALAGTVHGATAAALVYFGGRMIPVMLERTMDGVKLFTHAGQYLGKAGQYATNLLKGKSDVKIATKVINPLLQGEGRVGTFRELEKFGRKGDNLTPNHIPQDAYMKIYGVKRTEGIAIMMEQPVPGVGGRHRLTQTYGSRPNAGISPRKELASDIGDVRNIYKNDGVYTPEIRSALQEVIELNKQSFPHLFERGSL